MISTLLGTHIAVQRRIPNAKIVVEHGNPKVGDFGETCPNV